MNLDLNRISSESAVALDIRPWLQPLERCEQFARQHAPWHLWLDKWSGPWAIRCDAAKQHWQDQAQKADDTLRRRDLRAKADAIPSGKTATLAVSVALGNRASLAGYCRRTCRWLDSLRRQYGERFAIVDLVADSRLLLNLGRASVLENVGLYAERTTGLPLIPGTALKGVVSTWACWTAHFDPSDQSFRGFSKDSIQRHNFTAAEARLAKRILGDDDPGGSQHAGEVVFLGGFPCTVPELGLDIVNPHYEEKEDGRNAKLLVVDRARLTPSPFLCLEPGTCWRFAFFVRPGAPDYAALVEQTKAWIADALTQTGLGAKTAAGYGRFRQPTDADRAAQERQEAEAAAAEAAARRNAEIALEKAWQQAAARATLNSDYGSDAIFKNRVLDNLTPAQLECLKPEVDLLKKPENEARREQLRKKLATREYRDTRKRLRDKEWFPKDWLPAQ
jgi:CRISPR type III-B/RAMP module RAMP protein Cmr6